MIITDDHAHMDTKHYNKLDEVVKHQKENNVKYIITNGIDLPSCKNALELSKKYDIILPAFGLYPPDLLAKGADEDESFVVDKEELTNPKKIDESFSWIEKNIKHAVALGEVGLDYSEKDCDKELQKNVFQRFIDLAIKYNLPIIVHSRKAEQDTLDMLIKSGHKKIVLHCFSGNKKLVQLAKENKFYFSIPTNIMRSQHFQMIVNMIDISRLLTETDAPYLSPDKDIFPNESRYIIESIKKIAEIKKMTEEETSQVIFQNFQKLYL